MPKKTAKSHNTKNSKLNLKKQIYFLCSCCAIIILLVLAQSNLLMYFKKEKILAETIDLEKEELLWKQVVGENPTYRDGWIELSKIQVELGNKPQAIVSFNKAKEIDPNSKKVQELKELLF